MGKASGQPVAFTTKGGQTVSFGSSGKNSNKAKKIKLLESRLKVIEKSFAVAAKEKAKSDAKAAKQAEKDAVRSAKAKKQQVLQGGKHADKPRAGKKDATRKSKASAESASDD